MIIGQGHRLDSANTSREYPDEGARQAGIILFFKLDSPTGLLLSDFSDLFSVCPCGKVFTRRVVDRHQRVCLAAIAATKVRPDVPGSDVETDDSLTQVSQRIVIDLTGDSDDE
jgi:hypothetical protein